MLNMVLVAAVLSCFAVPFFGHLADRLGIRRVYMADAFAMMVMALPYFWMLDTRRTILIILAIVALMTAHDAMYGPQAAYITETFPAHIPLRWRLARLSGSVDHRRWARATDLALALRHVQDRLCDRRLSGGIVADKPGRRVLLGPTDQRHDERCCRRASAAAPHPNRRRRKMHRPSE